MIDFITEYFTFLVTVLGTIVALILGYLIYNWFFNIRPYRVSTKVKKEKPKKEKKKKEETVETTESESDSIVFKNIEVNEEEMLKTLDILGQEEEEPEVIEEEEEELIPEVLPETETKNLGRYHIIYRQKDGMWIIKREGSDKVIRVLHTQEEAIAYATIKAISQDTTYIIHKRDGKIRKTRY